MPVFAKAGSFIPMASGMPNTESYTCDTLYIKYFLAKDTLRHQSKLFYDDGKDPLKIQNGKYEVLNFKGYTLNHQNIIEISSTIIGKQRDLFFEIYQANKPEKVYLDNKVILRIKHQFKKLQQNNTTFYNPKNKTLQFHIKSNGTPIKVFF